MPKVTFIEYDSSEHEVEIEAGLSLMEGALDNLIMALLPSAVVAVSAVPVIALLIPEWVQATGEANAQENELLDMVDSRQPTSRLSCQIKVTEQMDGLIVRLPESQF